MMIAMSGAALAVAACDRSGEGRVLDAAAPANAVENQAPPAKVEPATPPLARTPLAEPTGPIDPKSAEAAGQIVQSYGALIEQKRWTEAAALWGDAGRAANFRAELAQFAVVHLEIGDLGETEGAAGSIYVTMPVVFYGPLKDGKSARRSADVILRRINDVPGSSAAQRRWHIERVEWKPAA